MSVCCAESPGCPSCTPWINPLTRLHVLCCPAQLSTSPPPPPSGCPCYHSPPPHHPQLLIADFFLVLGSLGWLGAGLAVKAASGSSALLDGWLPLWQWVWQPAIGVLMAGALVSGGMGWLKEQAAGKQR